jgi:serine/threonine-protein kinase RsbW
MEMRRYDPVGGTARMPTELPQCEFEPNKLILRLNITLQADPEAISPVVDGVMATAREMKCAAGKELEIETALREALANAIKHGCKNDPSKQVQCCVACDETRGMLIIVRDPGKGFDPAAIPSPVVGENVYSEHGRGIYLINELMDEVDIRRGGAEIVMRKR